MKRCAFYLRCSTDQQSVEAQLIALTEVAQRSGWTVVHVFKDEGISGAKGRDKRPGFDALLKAVARREVQIVAAWSVDRLGRSLSDLVGLLEDLQAHGCDLFLHQQALDSSTPAGKMLFQLAGVFAEYERALIRARVKASVARARARGVRLGRPPTSPAKLAQVRRDLIAGKKSIREIARQAGVGSATVMRVKHALNAQADRTETVAG